MTDKPLVALGLMSGTSLDGVDAAIIVTDGQSIQDFGAALTLPYDDGLRERLRGLLGGQAGDEEVAAVERAVTLFHAQAVRALLDKAGLTPDRVDVVGFHGHTILHRPDQRRTWQIGDGALLARETGIAVVNDFRTADVAAGGQGAPLVPVFHAALAQDLPRPLAVLNLGGVGNVTWIGEDGNLLAFDTGPANALIDDWALRHTGCPVDVGGQLALAGKADQEAVAAFTGHAFFRRQPPKSLDRDDFRAFAGKLTAGLTPADGAATLAEFTCAAVAMAAGHFPVPAKAWLVCGGGRHNPVLMDGLRRRLEDVRPADDVGWDGDALEAQAFAFLAVRSLRGLALSFPGTTGVREPMRGGWTHLPGK